MTSREVYRRRLRVRAAVRALFWVGVFGFAWFALTAVERGVPFATPVALLAGVSLGLVAWALMGRRVL